MNIFPELTLGQTEELVIAEKLSDPAVKKYLNMLAYNTGKSILLSQPGPGMTDEQYLRTLATAKGQLAVIDMLLSFQPANKTAIPGQ